MRIKYTDILDKAKSQYRAGGTIENIELMIRGHADMTSTDPEPTIRAFNEWVETEGRDYRRAAQQKAYQKRKDAILARQKQYYQDNIEKRREYDRKRRQSPEYKERMRAYGKAWRAKHPDKVKAYNEKHNARRKAEKGAE